MASLRGEIGCTGADGVRQWRAAAFQNLPVAVNLDRLAAFVNSTHLFRCFCNAFSKHFKTAYTSPRCSSFCLSSPEHGAPVLHPNHPDFTQGGDGCTESSYYSDGHSIVSSCNSSSHYEAPLDQQGSCHHDLRCAQHFHETWRHGVEGSLRSVWRHMSAFSCTLV